MPDATLFHGIAVVIDDEIDVTGTGIRIIKTQIEAAGCHVVPCQSCQMPTVSQIFGKLHSSSLTGICTGNLFFQQWVKKVYR